MCLPRIGRIGSISGDEVARTAGVEIDGVSQQVSLLCVPEAQIGDDVSIHAGFALAVLPPAEARATIALLDAVKKPGTVPGPTP